MRAIAVVGANAGDEGKGSVTAYHATPSTLVVRYSGGANAGHTVVHDGRLHVFRHFGSGSLNGAPTFLASHFVSNPILYLNELDQLRLVRCNPVVYVDHRSLVTTPWDMVVNQIVEESRGEARHGSCGVGINETHQRHTQVPLQVADLRSVATVRSRCEMIRHDWVPDRLRQLDVVPKEQWQDWLASPVVLDRFIESCQEYVRSVQVSESLPDVLRSAHCDRVIFEGSQGLLLDQDHHWFPHVTHAATGVRHAAALAAEAGLSELDLIYVSRAYATRHGAGPFPREVAGMSYPDPTNQPNAWQGTLRFGRLDLDLLAESVMHDRRQAVITVHCGLALTCLDQVSEKVDVWYHGQMMKADQHELIKLTCRLIDAEYCLIARGRSTRDVREIPGEFT